MEMKDIHLDGRLKLYMQWPLIAMAFLIGLDIEMYFVNVQAGNVTSVFVAVYALIVAALYFYMKSLMLSDLIRFACQYCGLENAFLRDLPFPYMVLGVDGRLLWRNDSFLELIGGQEKEKYIHKVIPGLNIGAFSQAKEDFVGLDISFRGRDYHVELQKARIESRVAALAAKGRKSVGGQLIAACMQDVTELNSYIKKCQQEHLIAGLVYIDNYDEILESVEEVLQSLLVALIDQKINKYFSGVDGLVKKLEKDKYFVVLKNESFQKLQADRFSILEDVKQINIGNLRPGATLSIGLGINSSTYTSSYNNARIAIDLALARGGNQAAIKDSGHIVYFGGNQEQTVKKTRVKARVKAEALREFIMAKELVLVMGHKLADADSFGACIGIYRAARELKKKAHIVISTITSSVRPLYNEITADDSYEKDLFLSPKEARDYFSDNAMVVVVDTNKPQLTECPELLKKCRTIAVLDHHRQESKAIENAVLSYIEPYSSSACEMVAEVLQYIVEGIRFPAVEANCLYAGIMIDTRNFMERTGVRTFEAAAFLRRCGADVTHVRKIFREDMASYRAKAEALRLSEVYEGHYAIAKCPGTVDSPTVLAARTADELLDIRRIKASFVFTVYEGKVFLSCRSIDEVNVQRVAEELGGGGHINAAGVQFDNTDISEDIKILKRTLDRMTARGDL